MPDRGCRSSGRLLSRILEFFRPREVHPPDAVRWNRSVRPAVVLAGVGGRENKRNNLTYDRPAEPDGGQLGQQGSRAPIKIVDGRPWSPSVYRNMRQIGLTLDEAWKKAFIKVSHF